ncbi:FtsX-like permease family protein [Nibrella saemangeumensis]|uniref:FtsX-like permease family protein n=1 Tax=Nibrella saemangeumensis TaxID=1084526 RepID=A0ABP8MP94_9BACT
MNLPYWIAHRYFFSRKKRSFISMLSILSMLGVGVGTMALVVVLSVFNGMEELNRAIFKTFEADLTISPKQGKRFQASDTLLTRIRQTPGVGLVTSVIEDNALARYADAQTVVKLKGVEENYLQRRQLDTAVVEGRLLLRDNNATFAVVAEGVRNELSIRREDVLTPLELWYPQRGATLSVLSTDAFNQQALNVSGVFFIEQRYDDYVIAPISVVRALVDYEPDELTNIEIQLAPRAELATVKKALLPVVGESLQIRDRDDLNTDLYRAIRIEKLFVALTLSFIILVASMNIFFSLSMLVIEKKEDIRILNAMGATPGLIRRIFLTEGTIIALIGALVGLALGVGLCLLQEEYGFVQMGTVSSIIDAYPVRVEAGDLILTGTVVILITLLTSWFPAQRAARSMT